MINLKLQCIVYSAFLIILNVVQAEQPKSTFSVEELKNLASTIEVTEKRLRNIKIESEAWVETKADLSDPCEPWQRTPICLSSTVWFTGDYRSSWTWFYPQDKSEKPIEGKARLDIHKIVLGWENGAAPYLKRNYSVSFDGQCGRYIYNWDSYGGKVFRINKYHVSPNAPNELKGGWWHKMVGINASLNFHFSNEQLGFSGQLKNAADPNLALKNAELEVNFQKLTGIGCINMSLKGKRFRKNWWLDPNRGFALLKHESARNDKDGNEVLTNSIDVRRLDKVAENIWWPVEVYFVSSPFGIANPWKRIVYRATNVVANDPNFHDSIFMVPVPEGYLVDEAEYKTIYTGHPVDEEKK
jgi:hypothetical protein